MNLYTCFWSDKKIDVKAETADAAVKLAAQQWKRKTVTNIWVMLKSSETDHEQRD